MAVGIVPSISLVVLSNPNSGRNRKGALSAIETICDRHGISHHRVTNADDVTQAITTLSTNMPDVLAINSGDGTVNLVIGALRKLALPKEPILALIGGGSTNMIHRDCGLRGSPARALRTLLRWQARGSKAAPIVTRQPFIVTQAATEPRYGFFLATGAIPRITAAVRDRLHPRGLIGRTGEILTLLQTLWTLWRKRDLAVHPLLAPHPFTWRADDQLQTQSLIFFAATTLQRLLFKVRTQATANKLGLLAMTADRKLQHGRAATLAFTATEDWVIDGEVLQPGDYQIVLAAPFRLLSNA